ncbi:MAG: hypothetical protein IJ523_10240 [Succinivibrionaceae bacterium]|nr:hypothetical protein [Succinivibrionaceae bacterium]
MNKLSLTGSVNRVTVEQSFKWISMACLTMVRHSRAALVSILLYGIFNSLLSILALLTPFGNLLYIFFFPVVGSIIVNLHAAVSGDRLEPGFYHGFRAPHFVRLLISNLWLFVAFLLVVAAAAMYWMNSSLSLEQNVEVYKRFMELMSSGRPVQFNGLNDLIAMLGVNISTWELVDLFRHLMAFICVLMLVFTIVSLYFMLVPFFVVLTYTEVKLMRLNMYFLSFRALIKIANFLPYLLYGSVVGLGSLMYMGCVGMLLGGLPLPLPFKVVATCLLNAPASVFLIHSLYFAFIDLFCDTAYKQSCRNESHDMGVMKI